MKIVHISTYDTFGGASRSAYRLHSGLRQIGHESLMIVASKFSEDPSVMEFKKPKDLKNLVKRGFRKMLIEREFNRYLPSRPGKYERFSDDRVPHGAELLRQIPASEIINLHWVAGFIDYSEFFRNAAVSKPIVWTLHDLNPMTGGCHFDLGCDRFVVGCGKCPQLGSEDSKDLSSKIWKRKMRNFLALPEKKLHLVTPSRWLGQQVKRSPLLKGFHVDVIPYGLDLSRFAPMDGGKVRDLMGIPRKARVLLFVADQIDNKRKGFSFLMESISMFVKRLPNLLLLSIGKNRPPVQSDIPSMHVGSIDNDFFLSMVYNAADLFAISSLQDNLPNTVLEAMACGIPIVAFDVGGISDMIRDGENGHLVDVQDVACLASVIENLLRDETKRIHMGKTARLIAEGEYDLNLQAERYSALYRNLSLRSAGK